MPASTVKLDSAFKIRSPLARKVGHRLVLTACGLLLLFTSGVAKGQSAEQAIRAWIKVSSVEPPKVHVQLALPSAPKILSFRNTYGGMMGLGERIQNVLANSHNIDGVIVRKLAPGEFDNGASATRFEYDVSLTEPPRPADMSHVSWLNKRYGLLKLSDLLPQTQKIAGTVFQINVEVPAGWTIASNIKTDEKHQYLTDDADSAVFIVGSDLRKETERIGPLTFSVITSGKWPFSGKNAVKISRRIIEEYSKITAKELKGDAFVMLLPFPGDVGPEHWSAETRGNSVVLLLGNKGSRKIVYARAGVALSHELFHLWVPNSLKLVGDYDWFFEGFSLYQALRMALRLDLISFDSYLQTLARVYDTYSSVRASAKLSLLEASERRWTTSSAVVYNQGMLAALIYDLSIRNSTDCKASIDDVYKQLFEFHSTRQANANETIIGLLNAPAGMETFSKVYVESRGEYDFSSLFAAYGLELRRGSSTKNPTKLIVSRDLSAAQRKRLACLGYY